MTKLTTKRPDVKLVSEYKSMEEKVCVKYSKCGHEVWIKARSLLHGKPTGTCSKCAKQIAGRKKSKTHAEFMNDYYAKSAHNITVRGKYTGCKEKIEVECLDCGLVWAPQAGDLLADHGCPACGGVYNYTPEEYLQLVHNRAPGTTVLSDYVNGRTDVHRFCLKCGYDWWSSPRLPLRGYGCPRCAGKITKTAEQFAAELHDINPYIQVVGQYVGRHKNIEVACVKCGHHWEPQPGNLLCGWGCPKCKASRGERRIMKHLDTLGLPYKKEHSFPDCKDDHVLLFDIYIPSKNMIVEYDGEQHFYPVKFGGKSDSKAEGRYFRTVEHDKIKNNYCATKGIQVLRIPYTDYDNIETILDKHLL